MNYILVSEGERRLSAFSDFVETVNHQDVPQVGFYTRLDPTLRIVRNRTRNRTESQPFALAHYHVDSALAEQPASHFRPIDIDVLMQAADKYDYVFFGAITSTHQTADYQVIPAAQYLARTSDGTLVDVETELPVGGNDGGMTFVTSFFGFVRVIGLPLYYMVLNPSLVHPTDGFDYHGQHTTWMLLNNRDGSLRNRVFTPTVSGAYQAGDTIVCGRGTTFKLDFFGGSCSVFDSSLSTDILMSVPVHVHASQNLTHAVNHNHIEVTVGDDPGYIEIEFNCGHFFEVASDTENLKFKYAVLPGNYGQL